MLKDALVPHDEVQDSEGLEFLVLAASPTEAVLQLSPEIDAEKEDLFRFYTVVRRSTDGVWVFRDAHDVYLTDFN